MKTFYIIFLIFFLLQCSHQFNWIDYRGMKGTGSVAEHIFPPLGLKWKIKIQEEGMKKKRAFNPPIVVDNIIYFGSPDGNFYAFDIDSGYMKWIFKTKAAVNSVPYADDKNVYFGSNDGNVYAVNRKTGEQVWSFYTNKTVQSLILRYKDKIIFTSDTGATYFLTPEGKQEFSLPNPIWSHHTFQVYENVLYWAPRGRTFGAYEIETKRFLWFVDVTAPYPLWYSFPAIDEKKIYFGSSFFKGCHFSLCDVEFNYYALDRLTGEVIWQKTDQFYIGSANQLLNEKTMFLDHVELLDYMAPSLWKDYVIFTSGDSLVRAFHKDTGEIIWTKEFNNFTSSAPTIAGDRIYFGLSGINEKTDTGFFVRRPKLICLYAKDGSFIWEYETEGNILNSPLITKGKIIFGTDENIFYILEEVFQSPSLIDIRNLLN